MRERRLTAKELNILDPTGQARAKLKSYRVGQPTPVPFPFAHKNREQWLQEARAIRNSLKGKKWQPYIDWDLSLEAKYGAQGASFDLDELKASYYASYQNAQYNAEFKIAIVGRDMLLTLLREIIEQFGYPSPIPSYSGTQGTLSGLPLMLHKGEFLAETYQAKRWRHVVADLPGERDQRQKHRCINMDAISNVRYIEEPLARVRNYLRTHIKYFASWLRPDLLEQPIITRALGRKFGAASFDYDHCDEHFSLKTSVEIVGPIYELLLDPMEFYRVFSFVEELFHQDIFLGDSVLEGLHNLLSGEVITNDFETIYDVCLALGVAMVMHLGWDDFEILANGDDVLLLINGSELTIRKAIDLYIEEAEQNGMAMSVEKCSHSFGHLFYLRRFYTPSIEAYNINGEGYCRGAYPLVLTYNSIVNPERYIKDPAELMQASLQRTDNLYGSPLFSNAVGNIFANWKASFPSEAEIREARIYDWWSRLYGIQWELDKSVSYQELKKLHIL